MEPKTSKTTISNTLWRACDTFRGKIDSSIYKDYILVMLFVKYLSDTYKEHVEEYTKKYEGDTERIQRALTRDRFVLDEKSTFDHIYSKRNKSNVVGDAYEYMIGKFASDAGKKGGEFFTPSEVSELVSRLVKPKENDRIYDATIGSGSLVIRTAKKVPSGKVAIYGQERNGQTHSLCRMNMFLHKFDDANIAWGDTLSNPMFLEDGQLMKFQVIVANPPFSLDKWAMGFAGSGDERDFSMEASLDPYRIFEWGVPPKSKGHYAFVQHMLYSLAEGGRMGIVLPHGVLFRGATEGAIRKQIIELNLLDAVIGLPANLFFGTGIPACILVFKKNRSRRDILFIDASNDGHYEKGKNQNNLREEDIQRIVDAYDKYENIDRFAHVASPDEIKENEYNLNIPRYVDTFEEEVPVDMDAVKENIANIKLELAEVEVKMQKQVDELGL